jgi:hypothetical protein
MWRRCPNASASRPTELATRVERQQRVLGFGCSGHFVCHGSNPQDVFSPLCTNSGDANLYLGFLMCGKFFHLI